MKIEKILHGESWLTREERIYIRKFLVAVQQLFLAKGVQDSPLLILRVGDVATHLLLVRRQELALVQTDESKAMDAAALNGPLAEQIGKSRERLRKAIKELEEACARLGTPVDTGIAGEMLPLVRQTADLLQNDAPPEEENNTPVPV